ncbi:molybdate ABC transporter substrate-binding protein [Fulvivirga ulvae]|uniref:molybdate ABC transporter substrate-binding protein n=1 Tax=Fulvivirga ulvae TaxID=2904245 RepID=UPI001F1F6611|nr:molybdate ABC transporter substrate-binding protein [Fulvivirga ulvae]UII31479.1 molybdate ABC transporter substrate-binding protein [Fulvivirga ulvae]
MRKIESLLRSVVLLLLVACQAPEKPKLTIATAANMQFAMKELTRAFTDETGVSCDLIISSSGKLTAQIIEGAPYDVFVAANMMYPNELYNQGLTLEKPRVYAYGKLVLWSMVAGVYPTLELLSDSTIQHIALANPKTAPYGVAAIEVLRGEGLYDRLRPKLVFGESIAQTNQFITTESAEAGFTSMSVVLSPQMAGKGKWIEINPSLYTPIEQGIVVIKNESGTEMAEEFYAFIFSQRARQILTAYGYLVNE